MQVSEKKLKRVEISGMIFEIIIYSVHNLLFIQLLFTLACAK